MFRVRDITIVPALLAGLVFAACTPDASTGVPALRVHEQRPYEVVASATLGNVLWDRNKTPNGSWTAFFPGGGTVGDNFEVPAGQTWTIATLVLSSLKMPGPDPTVPVNSFPLQISFAPDVPSLLSGPNHPGAPIKTFSLSPVSSSANACCTTLNVEDLLFEIHPAVTLPPGKYWLVVSASAFTFATSVTDGTHALTPDAEPQYGWDHPGVYQDDLAFVLYGPESPATATADLQTLLDSFGLDHGTANALSVKLRHALDAIVAGDTGRACSELQAFLNQVSALAGKKMTAAQATALINEATRIRGLLGC